MADLTGGIPDVLRDLTDDMDGKWRQIKELADRGDLLCAGSIRGSDTDITDQGVVKGHAYSILKVVEACLAVVPTSTMISNDK